MLIKLPRRHTVPGKESAWPGSPSRTPALWPSPPGRVDVLDLKLNDPAAAPAFAGRYARQLHRVPPARERPLTAWPDIRCRGRPGVARRAAGPDCPVPGWPLCSRWPAWRCWPGAGWREQTRRVGLLKAAGATPGWSPPCCWPSTWSVALAAAAVGQAGRVAGRAAAHQARRRPARHRRRAALTPLTAGMVVAVALAVALAATLVPAIRAARTSTVSALADAARPPRRRAWLIALSAGCRCPCCSGCG